MTNAHYQLRLAQPDDLGFQRDLYATTREKEMNAAQFTPEMREQFIAMQFHAQTTHYTQYYPTAEWSIIECDGVRAGRLILYRCNEHIEIMDIALMPEFRGRGMGTDVLRDVFTEAQAKQLPVRLFAFTGERAIQLYHRLGFEDVRDDGIHTELVWRPQPQA
jgi:ribosomal protein S18 acetylase RimI-like enzyme